MYLLLRSQALATTPATLGPLVPPDDGAPYGVLMEFDIGATATTVAFATGDASLYLGSGGGVIGGGAHGDVNAAAKAFVIAAGRHRAPFSPTSVYPRPGAGEVYFYVLTPHGVLRASGVGQNFVSDNDPFSDMFYSGQGVITALRSHIGD